MAISFLKDKCQKWGCRKAAQSLSLGLVQWFRSAPVLAISFLKDKCQKWGCRKVPPPGDAKARCVLCSSWAKVRPSRIMFRLECVKSPPEPLPRAVCAVCAVCECVSVCSVWRIGVCEIAANAENRRQIGGYIIAPKSHLTAKKEGR